MASLVEELVTVLEEEEKIYQTLILMEKKDRHPDSGRCSGTGKTDMPGTARK